MLKLKDLLKEGKEDLVGTGKDKRGKKIEKTREVWVEYSRFASCPWFLFDRKFPYIKFVSIESVQHFILVFIYSFLVVVFLFFLISGLSSDFASYVRMG